MCATCTGRTADPSLSHEVADGKINVQSACALNMVYIYEGYSVTNLQWAVNKTSNEKKITHKNTYIFQPVKWFFSMFLSLPQWHITYTWHLNLTLRA
jgi:hypothetical protein